MFRLTILIQECPAEIRLNRWKHDDQSIWPLVFPGSRPGSSFAPPRRNSSEQQRYVGKWAARRSSALLGCFSSSLWRLVSFCGYCGCKIPPQISRSYSLHFPDAFFILCVLPAIFFFLQKSVFSPVRWSELKTQHNPRDRLQSRLFYNHNFIIIINHAS